ncbi:MAG: class I SAM-dependent methyltransferase [Vicinamibacteria bacterium]
MKRETVDALHAVNRRFYQERASEFGATRERPWSGWIELFDRYRALLPAGPRVLDLGCGNGRFARFLDQRLSCTFDYCGVDASPPALAEARKRLGSRENVVLIEHDFLSSESPLPPGFAGREFDLVALFGVLHHVPGSARRLQILRRLSESVAASGLLVFSVWEFDRHERFRKKIVPWAGRDLDVSDLEPGDYLLTWGSDAQGLRYCHAMSESEEDTLARSLPLDLLAKLQGREPNAYFVFRSMEKPPLHGGEARER